MSAALVVAFVTSTLAAVAGFGGAAVLLPALVITFGVRDSVPILTVAQLVGNGSPVWFNRRVLDYRDVGWFAFALGPCPSPSSVAVVAGRRGRSVPRKPPLRAFMLIGAGSEALSTVVNQGRCHSASRLVTP